MPFLDHPGTPAPEHSNGMFAMISSISNQFIDDPALLGPVSFQISRTYGFYQLPLAVLTHHMFPLWIVFLSQSNILFEAMFFPLVTFFMRQFVQTAFRILSGIIIGRLVPPAAQLRVRRLAKIFFKETALSWH